MQWTLYDFGRTQGRYCQAVDREQIEALALVRAQQTIAFEAAQAYFRLLAAEANLQVRDEALQRANSGPRRHQLPLHQRQRRPRRRAARRSGSRPDPGRNLRRSPGDSRCRIDAERRARPVGRGAAGDRAGRLRAGVRECRSSRAWKSPPLRAARSTWPAGPWPRPGNGLEAARGELLPKIYIRGSVIRADSPGPLNGWIEGAGIARRPVDLHGRRPSRRSPPQRGAGGRRHARHSNRSWTR